MSEGGVSGGGGSFSILRPVGGFHSSHSCSLIFGKSATVRKKEYLAKSKNARRATFLRRKLRAMVLKDEPVEHWFLAMIGREALRKHPEKQFT